MVPGIKSDRTSPAERLREKLEKKFPAYGAMLAEGMTPAEADRALETGGAISELDLLKLYSQCFRIPTFEEQLLELPEKLEGFSGDYLAAHSFLPIGKEGNTITIAAADPYDLDLAHYTIRTFFQCDVQFKFASRSLIDRMVQRLYLDLREESSAAPSDENELRRLAGESGIIRLVNDMLIQALEQGASDIHIEPEENELAIRFRIDGVISDHLKLPISDYPAIASRIKLVGNLNIAERRLPQDGRTNFQLGNQEIDIRISTIPIMNGESIVLRLLRKDAMRFDLRELGMNENILKKMEELISIPHGIILVVGPTGSGKTTTLYSAMCQLNDRHRKIITVEDPVEYQLPGLSQMQVNPKIGLTFANGLRSIVRQDPDVILVGEIRDKETADIAINAALTGHLVFSTLHTNDAVGAVVRLIDMGIEPFLITASLCGVLSQRLVRKVCPVCKGAGTAPDGSRCRHCAGSGFRGRSGIFELLTVNDALREAIHRRAASTEIESIARAAGMIPLFEDGMAKVAAGETTRAEVLRSATGVAEGDEEV
ncbi:MAG: Flp pilus assembly complex ATPase component TadA [Lentisphaeria bacterium]|nr:Flp pilus assembly complex ATPase component TadA [Lentisphaeria bacterium]